MKTFCSTRVSFLSGRRVPTAGRQTTFLYKHHHQKSSSVQIGVSDKCATGSTGPSDHCSPTFADSCSTLGHAVTYLRFSRNFTRLDVALKKWPHSWNCCSTSVDGGGSITKLSVPLCTSHLAAAEQLSWQRNNATLRHDDDSVKCCCLPRCRLGPNLASCMAAISRPNNGDNHHRSSALLGGHLGVVHLWANKLTGKFAVCPSAAAAATDNNIHWWTGPIGAIKATTATTTTGSTTRTRGDTRNNKWTSVGEGTRPQDNDQQGAQQEQVPFLDAVSRHATLSRWKRQWANTGAALPLTSWLTGRNAFNKLMSSSSSTSGRMAATLLLQSHNRIYTAAAPVMMIQASRSIHSVATSQLGSAVIGEVICKRHNGLIEGAQVQFPCCRLLWTGKPSLYSSDDAGHAANNKRCWRCDKPISATSTKTPDSSNTTTSDESSSAGKVPVCEKCGSIQPISTDVNFFGLFNLESSFDIDLAVLRQHYLRLQQNMHPDMNVNRSNTETGYSLDNSSIINSAYRTLRDPYQRALYLLRLRYNMTIDEGNIETEPELLLEIMELNEDIELAGNDKASLMDVSAHIEENLSAIVAQLKTAFAEDNASEARRLVVRYAYYNSALDKLRAQLV